MPTDDLSGISGLDDRHRTVLDQKAGITSYYELIMADRQRIVDAFGRRTLPAHARAGGRVAGRSAPPARLGD